ncbi:MAG: thiamine pyrophosphate-binding protein, partial [Acetobacteraceae bacterium]
MDSEPRTRIAAEDYLEALAAHGIDHLFCNPGTDFAPIVEAFARAAHTNRKVPRPMVVPHENAALSMAHGYTMITGRPQAVMLHTNVGTANSINMLIDASRDRVPVLLTSGRTPFTETGAEGSRSAHIHWAQEMYDQAGMLREMVKWDYEMKRGDQAATVVDRALELAMASPKGPVYLSLPREVLGEVMQTPAESNRAHRAGPRAPVPSPG